MQIAGSANNNEKAWNKRTFVGGNHSRGYNNSGNFIQDGGNRTNNSAISIFNQSDKKGNNLVGATGKKKVTSIASNGTTTRMAQKDGNKYEITEGKLKENFDNGEHDDKYNNNAQSNRTNLQKGNAGETITAGKIVQTVDTGRTNETSDGESYNTEAYFEGKDGKTIGIGVNTSDDKTADDAQKEVEQIGKDFSTKAEGADKSSQEKAAEIAKENSNAQTALDKFNNAMYETNCDGSLKKDDNGNPIPKDFTKMSSEDRKKAAQTVREAAQEFNKALRGSIEAGSDAEAVLNDTLKAMTAADAAIRDVDEGDENNKEQNTVVVNSSDNSNNQTQNQQRVVVSNNGENTQSQSTNSNNGTKSTDEAASNKTEERQDEKPETPEETAPEETVEIDIKNVINNENIKSIDDLNTYLAELGITDEAKIAGYKEQWQKGKDQQEYSKIINDPDIDWENITIEDIEQKVNNSPYLSDKNKDRIKTIYHEIQAAKYMVSLASRSEEDRNCKDKMYELIKNQPFPEDIEKYDTNETEKALNTEEYKDLTDFAKDFIRGIWNREFVEEEEE